MKKEIQLKFKLEYNIDPKKSGFYSQILRFPELLESYRNNGEFAYVDRAVIEEFGWKIHISSSLFDIENVIEKTFDVLTKYNSSFKILKSIDLYKFTSSKKVSRNSYGKLITIYPESYHQFRELLDELYIKLRNYKGPYILSDRRYKDSKCIYYRFGTNIGKYFNNDGSILRKYFYKNKEYIDTVNPYFELPEFVKDEINFNIEDSEIFNKKLKVLRAIQFSNTGGTYVAIYKPKNIKSIVKEARAYTALDNKVDSIKYRKHEKKLLIRLKDMNYIPNYIDDFETFDNYYLITEFIDGHTLTEYVQKNNPIYTDNNLLQNDNYIFYIFKLLKNITLKLIELNSLGIYIYDLSADNIIIKYGEFYFVDLEGAYDSKDFKYLDKVYSNHFIDLNKSKEQSQVYSLMILLIYCVYDITKIFINEEKLDINRKFLPISNKTSYYNNIVHLINSMYLGKINLIEVVEYIESNINKIYKDLEIECFESKIADEEIVSLYENYNIKDTLQLIKLGLEDTYKQQDLRKKYEDYSYVNKGIKSGYPGIAYVLNETNGFQTCEKIDDVILSMFSGYLGNVWIDYDVEVSKIKSNLNFNINDSSLIHGLSGIGISLIKKYLTNKDSNTLIFIKKIADKLLQNNSTFEKNGLFYGASGISLFLLYVYKLTNYDNYLFTGQKILQNDLNNLIEDKFGCILLKQDQSNISSPYFMNGSVGVASVLLRYYLYTKNIEYKKIAITIMDSLIYNLSLHTGLFEGMSGIANTFLDCYFIVGDVKYLNVAKRMANDISNSLHINNKFISGYTRDGENLSFSFDYGSSGIALFLDRLVKQKKYNFIPFLDREMELIHEQNDK